MPSTSIKTVENLGSVRVHSDVKPLVFTREVRTACLTSVSRLTSFTQRASQDGTRPGADLNEGDQEVTRYAALSSLPRRPYAHTVQAMSTPLSQSGVALTSIFANILFAPFSPL